MIVYYIRHGFPSYNPDCLTIRGKYEADKVGDYLKDKNIEQIFSSPSGRAHQTAEYTANKINLPIKSYEWALEDTSAKYILVDGKWIFWETNLTPILKEQINNKNWGKIPELSKAFEGVQFINKNLDEWLLSLNIKRDSKTNTFVKIGKTPEVVAFFAHGAMGCLFTPCLANLNPLDFWLNHIELETCGIAKFEINYDIPNGCKLLEYNFMAYSKEESNKLPATI